MKQILMLLLVACTITTAKAQKNPQPITDSIQILSIKDCDTFNKLLKKSVSYEEYLKLTPDVILGELVRWKVAELNKIKTVADTTIKK